MARADTRLEPAPRIPPVTALRTVARAGRFLRPYRREIVFAAIGLVVAASAVLAVGQGLKFVVDRGFAASNAGELDRMLGLMLVVIVVMAAATYMCYQHNICFRTFAKVLAYPLGAGVKTFFIRR